MLCKKPYRKGPQQFGCGQCLPCRINHKRTWTMRLYLEFLEWHDKGLPAAFITLTYNPKSHPTDGSLNKRHLQLFLKRLRKALEPHEIRYYAVGEYGEKTWRPHYHLIIFGIGPMQSMIIQKAWSDSSGDPMGHIHVGQNVELSAIQYCVSYLVNGKKGRGRTLTAPDGTQRAPEFAVMSLRPGIGYHAAQRIWASLRSCTSLDPQKLVLQQSTIRLPGSGKSKASTWALGRYMKEKIQLAAGIDKAVKGRYLSEKFFEAFDAQSIYTRQEVQQLYKAKADQQRVPLTPNKRMAL